MTPRVDDAVKAPAEVSEVWNIDAPVTPTPPACTNKVDANVATPVTPSVEEAVNAPRDVNEVWKVEAPVTPTPPDVTKRDVLNDLTPANVCAEVVTSPTSPTLAFGILNVCVEVVEDMLKLLPPVPVANV